MAPKKPTLSRILINTSPRKESTKTTTLSSLALIKSPINRSEVVIFFNPLFKSFWWWLILKQNIFEDKIYFALKNQGIKLRKKNLNLFSSLSSFRCYKLLFKYRFRSGSSEKYSTTLPKRWVIAGRFCQL